MQLIDLTGKRFGRLLVVATIANGSHTKVECLCDCGMKKVFFASNVSRGLSKSCGCLRKEVARKQLPNMGSTTHGLHRERFYKIFTGMKQRCNNAKKQQFKDYGGRGIKCLWQSFEDFREDMQASYLAHVEEFGEMNTTIDRVDSNGHYCRENCRWATRKEQSNNRRYVV